MLDPEQLVDVPADLGCTVYADNRVVGGFYAVATAPSVAVGFDGRPELQLTVYGRRTASGFEPSGALITLSTELSVAAASLDKVVALLRQHLAEAWPKDSDEPPITPALLSAEWADATVDVRLTGDIVLSGTPSLSGDNRCSFSANFDATQAKALADAWTDGLPEAHITYQGHVRSGQSTMSATAGSSSMSITVETDDGVEQALSQTIGVNSTTNFEGAYSAPSQLAVSASAPLAASLSDPASTVSNVELG